MTTEKKSKEPTKKFDVPVLKDIVVPGKNLPVKSTPPAVLSEVQMNVLQQQLEEIIEKRLQKVLNKATQDALTDIKTYLDKVLPKFIKAAQQKNE
jgi:hypothetical protein